MANAEFNTDEYILNTYFDEEFKGTMIEVGAAQPVFYSMSKLFRDNGWRTICIEPNPRYVEMHKKLGNEIYEYAVSESNQKNATFEIFIDLDTFNNGQDAEFHGMAGSGIKGRGLMSSSMTKQVINVDIVTLNWLLNDISVNEIDFVSIDVEGWELEVMKGFDTEKYKPKIICLENFNHLHSPPNHIELYNNYMDSIGYTLVTNLKYNYIFKRR